MKRVPLIVSFVLFVLLCVSSSYWVMRLVKPETRKILAPQVAQPVADVESVASLFGGVMLVTTNYHLKGIVQANPMSQSVAIIGVDGSPAKAYPVDTEVNGTALNEVYSNYVLLGDNGVSKRVDLPTNDAKSTQITEVITPAPDLPKGNRNTANKFKSTLRGK
ncbi:MAG: hypothetical protein K0R08_1765 [Solimicrobium sp.]|jgi:general secretion pathway protein C|nr:hypothetical protein [Solimicrobium sp.]